MWYIKQTNICHYFPSTYLKYFKYSQQCTMLPLSTKSCLKSSKLRPILNGLLLLTRYLPTEYQCHVPMYPIFSFTAKGYSASRTKHFIYLIGSPPFHNPTKNKKFATGRSSAQVFNFCALLDRIDLCLIPT